MTSISILRNLSFGLLIFSSCLDAFSQPLREWANKTYFVNFNYPGPAFNEHVSGTANYSEGFLQLTRDYSQYSIGVFHLRGAGEERFFGTFSLDMKVSTWGFGTQADGLSVGIIDSRDPMTYTQPEDGFDRGLYVTIDTFSNGQDDPAPVIGIVYNKRVVMERYADVTTPPGVFVPLSIRVDADGTVDVAYAKRMIFTNVKIDEYQPFWSPNFLIGARTGFYDANHFVDNLRVVVGERRPMVVKVNRPTPINAPPNHKGYGRMYILYPDHDIFGGINRNRPTVVMTHGWKASYKSWAKQLGEFMAAQGVDDYANIVAWDWHEKAYALDPYRPSLRVPAQAKYLARNLISTLGSDYQHGIHFVGHSLGSLVNGKTAQRLINAGRRAATPGFDPAKMHITILDEPLRLKVAITKSAVPHTTVGFVDDYITFYGEGRGPALNVSLCESKFHPAASHSYAHEWYRRSAISRVQNNFGFHLSFESPTNWNIAPEIVLQRNKDRFAGKNFTQKFRNEFEFKEADGCFVSIVQGSAATAAEEHTPVIFAKGNVAADFDENGLRLNLGATSEEDLEEEVGLFADTTEPTNNPAFTSTWIPLNLPTNAIGISLDFTFLASTPTNENLVIMIGTNELYFAESAGFAIDATNSTGMMDISRYAGSTNLELYVSLQGETNTVGEVQISNLKVIYPQLTFEALPGTNAVRWTISQAVYALESSTNLVTWTREPQIPTTDSGENEVLLPQTNTPKFFRLVKTGQFLPPEPEEDLGPVDEDGELPPPEDPA